MNHAVSGAVRKRRLGWTLVCLAGSLWGCGGDDGAATPGVQQGVMPPPSPSIDPGANPPAGNTVATDGATATDSSATATSDSTVTNPATTDDGAATGGNTPPSDAPPSDAPPSDAPPSDGQDGAGTMMGTPTDATTPDATTPDAMQDDGVAPVDTGGVVGFSEIQLDLDNVGGARGAYPSCTEAANCHQNPARNVIIVANPTPEQLQQNWQNIVQVASGVTPWVLPADDSAQMLNEVPTITTEVRARWLAWIEAGAPFDAP